MLQIKVPIGSERWDDEKEEFIEPESCVLNLEHSLVSLSKWESKWCKPFLSSIKTDEETLDYIKCMTLGNNVDPDVYNHLTPDNVKDIEQYINAPMTATTFRDDKRAKPNREIVTSDIIYYWMITLQIPPEYRYWHLNRLLALIRVCNIKNTPPKKMSRRETAEYYSKLNAERKKKMNTKG